MNKQINNGKKEGGKERRKGRREDGRKGKRKKRAHSETSLSTLCQHYRGHTPYWP